MSEKEREKLQKRVHNHTMRSMIDYANFGHGCETDKALNSAERLIAYVEGLVAAEYRRGFEDGAKSLAGGGAK